MFAIPMLMAFQLPYKVSKNYKFSKYGVCFSFQYDFYSGFLTLLKYIIMQKYLPIKLWKKKHFS